MIKSSMDDCIGSLPRINSAPKTVPTAEQGRNTNRRFESQHRLKS